MELKNDIKWLKEHRFVAEVGTPDTLDSKDELRKYVTQVNVCSQLNNDSDEESAAADVDV